MTKPRNMFSALIDDRTLKDIRHFCVENGMTNRDLVEQYILPAVRSQKPAAQPAPSVLDTTAAFEQEDSPPARSPSARSPSAVAVVPPSPSRAAGDPLVAELSSEQFGIAVDDDDLDEVLERV
jgi:hypothetical protein